MRRRSPAGRLAGDAAARRPGHPGRPGRRPADARRRRAAVIPARALAAAGQGRRCSPRSPRRPPQRARRRRRLRRPAQAHLRPAVRAGRPDRRRPAGAGRGPGSIVGWSSTAAWTCPPRSSACCRPAPPTCRSTRSTRPTAPPTTSPSAGADRADQPGRPRRRRRWTPTAVRRPWSGLAGPGLVRCRARAGQRRPCPRTRPPTSSTPPAPPAGQGRAGHAPQRRAAVRRAADERVRLRRRTTCGRCSTRTPSTSPSGSCGARCCYGGRLVVVPPWTTPLAGRLRRAARRRAA